MQKVHGVYEYIPNSLVATDIAVAQTICGAYWPCKQDCVVGYRLQVQALCLVLTLVAV